MTQAIDPINLDDLFDLDIDIVMPTPDLIGDGRHADRMDTTIGCSTTCDCGPGGLPPKTSWSTCDSYGQTGHPCQCF